MRRSKWQTKMIQVRDEAILLTHSCGNARNLEHKIIQDCGTESRSESKQAKETDVPK